MSSDEPFGKYRLQKRLAFGGMAEIFLASLRGVEGFAKRVVLKRILPQFSSDPAFIQMFIDEAVVAGRLSHPNVVQVYDFGAVDGIYYIAMEYVDGPDLRSLLRRAKALGRPLSFAEVATIGEGVARGLAYVHSACDDELGPLNIVHRDISPHNIMLSRTGDVKVMDFGIAKAVARATRTGTGMIKGKLAYMAPEQAAGQPLDGRCDQFALGLVMWECLTGQRLFDGASDLEIMRKVVACEVRPVRGLRPDVPELLEGVVMRALAPEREKRYADLSLLESELSRFRFSLGPAGAVRLASLVEELSTSTAGQGRQTKELGGATPSDVATTQETPPDEPVEATSTLIDAPGAVQHGSVEANAVPGAVTDASRPRLGNKAAVAAVLLLLCILGGTLLGWSWWRHQPISSSALRLSSQPPGARVLIDGSDVGLRTPTTLPKLSRGSELRVTLQLEGYLPWSTKVIVLRDVESVSTKLEKAHPAGVEAMHAIPAAAVIEPRDVPAADVQAPAMSGRHVRRDSQRAMGRLSLRVLGAWAEVYLGTRKLGTTPLDSVEVPAGSLKLRLVNPGAGIERTIALQVAPGMHVQRTVSLGEK